MTLEAFPQALLQLCIFYSVQTSKSGNVISSATGEGLSAAVRHTISWNLLAFSLSLSILNLTKVWASAIASADSLGITLSAYIHQQIQMGKGLPIDALRDDKLTECRVGFVRLDDEQIEICATVMRKLNRKLKAFDLEGCFKLPDARAPRMLYSAIAHHPTIEKVRIDERLDSTGDLSLIHI